MDGPITESEKLREERDAALERVAELEDAKGREFETRRGGARRIVRAEQTIGLVDDLRRRVVRGVAALPPGRNVQADAMFDIAAELRQILRGHRGPA